MDQLRLLDGRLKLRHLVLVDVLSAHGSVVAAAAALHITQPVATRTLRDLELILGVPLYERGPRGVTPTIFGETFTRHARSILAQLTQAGRQVTELADAHRGTVVVGADPGAANLLLLQAIARLKADRPQLTVVVREAAPEVLAVELGAGRLDLAVGRRPAVAAEAETYTPLYREPVGLFTRVQHPLARRPQLCFADLQAYPWIVPGADAGLRRDIEHLFARHSLPLPANRVELSAPLAVRRLLLAGDLIAPLPAPIGHGDPELHALPIPLQSVKSDIVITTATGRVLGPGAELLRQTLQDLADDDAVADPNAGAARPFAPSRAG